MGRTGWKVVSARKLSVRKRSLLKASVPKEADACPICGGPMKECEYTGKKKLASFPLGDSMQDLKEDGKVVWREVRKRSAS